MLAPFCYLLGAFFIGIGIFNGALDIIRILLWDIPESPTLKKAKAVKYREIEEEADKLGLKKLIGTGSRIEYISKHYGEWLLSEECKELEKLNPAFRKKWFQRWMIGTAIWLVGVILFFIGISIDPPI